MHPEYANKKYIDNTDLNIIEEYRELRFVFKYMLVCVNIKNARPVAILND